MYIYLSGNMPDQVDWAGNKSHCTSVISKAMDQILPRRALSPVHQVTRAAWRTFDILPKMMVRELSPHVK